MHIGIIPDGNRRWAHLRDTSLSEAYAVGFCNVIDLTLRLFALGFLQVTFFGLSNDNLKKRPVNQVDEIMTRMIDSMRVASALLKSHQVRVRIFGNIAELPKEIQWGLLSIEEAAVRNPNRQYFMNILVNYSVRWDLKNKLGEHETRNIPNCDLIFRSGGQPRLSGFLPIQSSLANFMFTETLWPDIRPKLIDRELYLLANQPVNLGA